MDVNFFDDLFDDAPFELFDFADSLFRTPSATSQPEIINRHGPFHTSRSGLLPTLTPRLSTTGPFATAPVTARPRFPANLSSTPQQRPNLSSGLFPSTRAELPAARTSNYNTTSRNPTTAAAPDSDDYYLNQLATQRFSSPSLPSRSPRPSGRNQEATNNLNQRSLRNPAASSLSGADLLRRADQLVAGPSFNPTQADPRLDLQRPSFPTSESSDTNMPAGAPRKRRETSDPDSDLLEQPTPAGPSRPCPRQRNSRVYSQHQQQQQQRQQRSRPVEILDSDDPFGSPPPPRHRIQRESPSEEKYSPANKRKRDEFESIFGSDDEEIPIVDLVNPEKVSEAISQQKQKPKNEVKLGTFQCVICMDDCTDLTVTHCGHLFCSECLHSSLHIDVSKKVCPICRQAVETKPAGGKFTQKQKGFYHLELKLMTKKTLGRRPASQQQ